MQSTTILDVRIHSSKTPQAELDQLLSILTFDPTRTQADEAQRREQVCQIWRDC